MPASPVRKKHFILAERKREGEPRHEMAVSRKTQEVNSQLKNAVSDRSSALFPVWYPRTLDRLEKRPL